MPELSDPAARVRPRQDGPPVRHLPDFALEAAEPGPVCGIDEAGRGPWAGPVVAAAVILDPRDIPPGLDDSKRLSPARRAALLHALEATDCRIGIGAASVAEIERFNILQASYIAMRRAFASLGGSPALALIDGRGLPPGLECPARGIVGGDGRSASIAAASIAAKVHRDRIMVSLAQQFPGYGWETNMGYGTRAHASGLARLGVTAHHRRSFRPIHKILYEPLCY